MRRKCVETGDCFAIPGKDENGSEFALHILTRLLAQISIEFGGPAGKCCTIMILPERFYSVFVRKRPSCHYLPARCL